MAKDIEEVLPFAQGPQNIASKPSLKDRLSTVFSHPAPDPEDDPSFETRFKRYWSMLKSKGKAIAQTDTVRYIMSKLKGSEYATLRNNIKSNNISDLKPGEIIDQLKTVFSESVRLFK